MAEFPDLPGISKLISVADGQHMRLKAHRSAQERRTASIQ
jgi:environmental stress-induced protein Ves